MLLIPFTVFGLCQNADLSDKFSFYVALTLWAIYCWVSNIVNTTIIAMFLPILYLSFDVADSRTVFAPWGSTVSWLCLGGLFLGKMLIKCGLILRVSYKCMLFSSGSFIRILLGIMIAGFLVAPLIPSALGKCTIFFILGTGICVSLDISPESKTSATIFMTCLFAVTGPSYAFLTSCAQAPVAIQLMESVCNVKTTWFEYAYHNVVPSLIYTVVSFVSILLSLRPGKLPGIKNVIEEKYAALGPLSKDEKKAITILILILLLLVSESLHKINAAWCMMFLAFIMFLPGVDLLHSDDVDKVSFSLIFFLAGAMSIGAVAAEIGIAEKVTSYATLFLSTDEAFIHIAVFFFLVCCVCFFFHQSQDLPRLAYP